MAARLPHRLTLSQARKAKAKLFASLTARELELLLLVEPPTEHSLPTGSLFGGRKGTSCVISRNTTTVKVDRLGRRRTKTTTERERINELPVLLGLERAGWLRFVNHTPSSMGEPAGDYLLTDNAKTVLRACREGKSPLLS